MSTPLVKAIDELTRFVTGLTSQVSREEMDRFRQLDTAVLLRAREAGLDSRLPARDALARHLDQHGPHVVEFEGATNLPGDWIDGVYALVGEHHWLAAR